jgi:hypothetical protein
MYLFHVSPHHREKNTDFLCVCHRTTARRTQIFHIFHAAPLVVLVTACSTLRLHVSPDHRMLNTDFLNVTASPHVVDADHPAGTACYTYHRMLYTTTPCVTVSPHVLHRFSTCHRITEFSCITASPHHRMSLTQVFHATPLVVRVTACSTLQFHVSPHHRMLNTDFPYVTASPQVVDTDHPAGTAC